MMFEDTLTSAEAAAIHQPSQHGTSAIAGSSPENAATDENSPDFNRDDDSNPGRNSVVARAALPVERFESLSTHWVSPAKTDTTEQDKLLAVKRAAIAVVSFYGYRSLLSNATSCGGWSLLVPCHVVETKLGADIFKALGRPLGMPNNAALDPGSPWNIFFLSLGERLAFDRDCFFLIPTEEVCRDILKWIKNEGGETNGANYRATFPGGKLWKYRFYALKANQLTEGHYFIWKELEGRPGAGPRSRIRDWRDCNDGSWGSVRSHLNPLNVFFRAGIAMYRQGVEVNRDIDQNSSFYTSLDFIQTGFEILRREMGKLDCMREGWEERLQQAP
ncbi:hypothetical protein DL96DRAFT_1550466 [Flagelloscypha sp. PMI_526]|nr:hypothetical protein DL96DRAFT_1550466 [Flagelloscypha sp. PMI_526]